MALHMASPVGHVSSNGGRLSCPMRGPNRNTEGPHGQAVGVPGSRVPGGGTPLLGWLALRPRVCAPLPAEPVLRRHPCASRSLCFPAAGHRPFPPTLGHLLGTPEKAQRR